MPIKIILEDGTERELPDGFPTTQKELDAIRDRALAPKLQRITELDGQVKTLISERDAATAQVAEKDQKIGQLETDLTGKSRELLVTTVANAKGVPAKWLRGDDQAALEASADEWLADAKGIVKPSGDGEGEGKGGTGNGGAGGYVGSAGTGSEEPTRPSFEEAKQAAYERARNQQKGALIS